jgi:mannose-6-phosphate isomerase-like protein (cupin superfamily)
MTPKETIRRLNPDAEFYTPERCFIVELSNVPDDSAVSIARARVAPGVMTRWHRLIGTVERYVILEGQGLVEVGSLAPQEVKAGDVVLIPASCRQRIANIGQKDLIFFAVCTPRFTNEVYEDLDSATATTRAPVSGGKATAAKSASRSHRCSR